jgi:hypothetical protein
MNSPTSSVRRSRISAALVPAILAAALGVRLSAHQQPVASSKINMVYGTTFPDGDPHLQRQRGLRVETAAPVCTGSRARRAQERMHRQKASVGQTLQAAPRRIKVGGTEYSTKRRSYANVALAHGAHSAPPSSLPERCVSTQPLALSLMADDAITGFIHRQP